MATDLHGILMGISRKHRKYLITTHKASFADQSRIKDDADGTTRLARLLGPAGVAPYRFLNLDRSAHLYSWYECPAELTVQSVKDHLKTRYPKWRTGERPKPVENGPPLFHVAYDSGDALEVVYSSYGGEHVLHDGYDSHKRTAYVLDKLLVRPDPTTVEVSGGVRGLAQRDKLIAAFAAEFGFDVGRFALRSLDTPARRDSLAAQFNATAYGVAGNGRSKGVASYSWRTKRSTPLEDQEHYKQIKGPHLDPREVEFKFYLAHADGWQEDVTYFVNFLTGQIKFAPETSEYAITRVRDATLAIAR